MQIHEIESKTRLTKKSIRYYEEEGLISPKRNALNDYREYDENDLNTLKLIKFLRELNIPINDIKKLHSQIRIFGKHLYLGTLSFLIYLHY